MGKSMSKCAVVGGIIVFIWCMISWMVFPWHKATFQRFKNESEVASVIKSNAMESGMYMLPSYKTDRDDSYQRQMKSQEMMRTGPFVFASVKLDGMNPKSAGPYIGALIIDIVSAYLIVWLLFKTKGLKYMQQTGFVAMVGLTAGVISLFPAWNWMGFSWSYVIVGICDMVIAWFLAGLAIAKLAKRH
jgi:hypothetical protein